jgi:hypothetical protein
MNLWVFSTPNKSFVDVAGPFFFSRKNDEKLPQKNKHCSNHVEYGLICGTNK